MHEQLTGKALLGSEKAGQELRDQNLAGCEPAVF